MEYHPLGVTKFWASLGKISANYQTCAKLAKNLPKIVLKLAKNLSETCP